LKRPGLRLAIEINQRVRSDDEWFDEPDDLVRVEFALRSIHDFDDPVAAAGAIAFRVAKAQASLKGTRGLLYCWPGGLSTTTDGTAAESSILKTASWPTCSFMQHPVATLKPRFSSSSPIERDFSQHLVPN
jgi:hypothetical protein